MPLPPPEEHIDSFVRAVRSLAVGDVPTADREAEALRVDLPTRAPRPPIPRPLQVATLRRDRFTCRYCGTRTVPSPVLRAASLVWPDVFPYNPNWRTDATHPLYVSRAATIDHLRPHAHGGASNALGNLVTACWACNLQKSEFTLERLGWALLDIPVSDWDGLVGAYPALWEQGGRHATESDVRFHTAWLAAFAQRTS